MKIRWLHTQVALIILLLFIGVFLFGYISTGESYCWFKPYIDTKFAKNYTPQKFEMIKIGMSKNEVYQLIGEPLAIEEVGYNILKKELIYTRDGLLNELAEKKGKVGADFAWYSSNVILNEENQVIEIHKFWSND